MSTDRPDKSFWVKASAALGIRFDPHDAQEWGYLNADGTRVLEFMEFWRIHRAEFGDASVELVELVLYSYGQVLQGERSGPPPNVLEAAMERFVEECRSVPHWLAFRSVLNEPESLLAVWLLGRCSVMGVDVGWYTDDSRSR